MRCFRVMRTELEKSKVLTHTDMVVKIIAAQGEEPLTRRELWRKKCANQNGNAGKWRKKL